MDQACLPSSSADVEKGFCVKNIPIGFKEWELFHIFRKYGVVHNVKIPTKQNYSNCKYGFVVMEDFNGADAVRCQLKNGKFLILDNGVQLQVSSVHHGEQQRTRSDNVETASRVPLKDLQCTESSVANRKNTSDRHASQKVHQSSSCVRCFSQDLPLQTAVQVRVVDSPYPCKSAQEDFVFHVIPIGQKLGEEYTALQREMNKFCLTNPNLQHLPKVGEYVLYGRSATAYRALCNSDRTLYLVDTGETVLLNLSQLWEIAPFFARLPSLVIPCGIAGIKWNNPSDAIFNKCRNALSQWSRSHAAGLRATACGFYGLKNLVNLVAVSDDVTDDFASCIATKGMCTQSSQERHFYSREDVLDAKNVLKDKDISPFINYNENIAEIINGTQAMAVA